MVVAVIGLLVVWSLTRPVRVTVDGAARSVPARTTVSDLGARSLLNTERGALRDINGKVIKARGGEAARVTRNGHPVSSEQQLYDGDVIISHKGADITEEKVTRREALPIEVVHEGAGPVIALRRLGTPGVAEVVEGKASGVEATRSVVATGDAMVLVHRGAAAGDKLVALTFDDGPWPGQTDKVLATLKANNVHATFFMLGSQVRRNPELARQVAAEGHLLGSHSGTHKELTKLKPGKIRAEIASGISAIKAATGVRPVWFRPPYGAVNKDVRKQARALDTRIAMWDIDTLDWTKPGVHELYRNAVRSTKPGQVVLMHDGGDNRKQTIEALPIIIDDLRSKGFSFVTMDELEAAR